MDRLEAENIAEGAVIVYNANTDLESAVVDLINLHNINDAAARIAIYAIDRYVDQMGAT